MLTIKQEFDKISGEVEEIRQLVKQECIEKSGISHELRNFEEFKVVVMD